jgi:mannose-6-phosphate isomerase-like protein (cupin superfamily)
VLAEVGAEAALAVVNVLHALPSVGWVRRCSVQHPGTMRRVMEIIRHTGRAMTVPSASSITPASIRRRNMTEIPAKVTLDEKFAAFDDHWKPHVVAELNGQHVKVVKFQGEFVWHQHESEDELFLVHRGAFRMEYRDRVVELTAGDFVVVPRGVEHRPVAEQEVEVILFEPAGTLNTGDVRDAFTVEELDRI